jgi:hypothetical protein
MSKQQKAEMEHGLEATGLLDLWRRKRIWLPNSLLI